MIIDPDDPIASPLGWHNDGTTSTTNTTYVHFFLVGTKFTTSWPIICSGNNVQTFKWLDPGYAYTNSQQSSASQSLIFDYPADSNLEPGVFVNGTYPNLDAARTNAFYVMNVMHDFFWQYGFTEDAFNYQVKNLGGRGANTKSNDPVRVSVQAADTGENNAFFASPAEYVLFFLRWCPEF